MEGILLALAVFLLSMDQQVLTRSLQRPLIACTIFGLILGNAGTGLAVGAALEMTMLSFDTERYYFSRPASVLYSCFSVLLAVKANLIAAEAAGAAIVFFGIGAGIVHLLSAGNLIFLQQARKAAETRNEKKLASANFIPLLISGLIPAVIALIGAANAESFVTAMETMGDKWGWIPEGFAHGFYVMSETAEFVYKCTNYYDPTSEHSILWNDKDIGIEWPLVEGVEVKVSEKDGKATSFKDALNF